MRKAIALIMCFGVLSTAQADAYKCLGPNGKVVFTDVPCEDWERAVKVRSSESVADPEVAARDLARQKAVAEQSAASRPATGGVSVLADPAGQPASTSNELTFPGGSSSGGDLPGNLPKGMPILPRN